MATQRKDTPVFHLGFTMAGAVSAGAYTAGFMDYILEALKEWEKSKVKNWEVGVGHKDYDPRIPMHDISIDALGGASAGGMVSMITALSFFHKEMNPVKKKSYTKTGNILYDSWVFLDDDLEGSAKHKKITFEKMLDNEDLDKTKATGIPSLLNSTPIDNIAENIFNDLPEGASIKNFPKYISKDLRVLLTITSLTPIDYTIKFSKIKSAFLDTTPGHKISNHSVVGHFKVDYKDNDKDTFLSFNPFDKKTKEFLIKSTKATGAFPIGLAPRHFDEEFSKSYINTSLSRRISLIKNMEISFSDNQGSFNFTGVDGGTLNNEPFDEVIRTLHEKHGTIDPHAPKYGTLMIDPFPNFEKSIETESPYQKNIMAIIGKLLGTIMNQARNKDTDTYNMGFFKLLAFPIKWKSKGKLEPDALACGGLGGFGGFFDIEFRMHDFFLGRDNARNFLRRYLCLEYNENDPIDLFKNLTPEAVKMFTTKYKDPETKAEKLYMPIIPDISYIEAKKTGNTNPYDYTIKEFPKLKKQDIESLRKPIKERVKKMVKLEINRNVNGFFLKGTLRLFTGVIGNKISKWVYKKIIDDFTARDMYDG